MRTNAAKRRNMRAKAETVLQDKEEYLKKLPYWQYLSQDEKRSALRHAFLYEYKRGAWCGASAANVWAC